ncbi:MAG TPA: hypothetical protein VF278_21685, partial [Pirellulales bacterium]
PCEFVHKEFWDGVNFRRGANPPRERWVAPPQKTPAESAVAWRNFEGYMRFIRGFDDVKFITASEAAKLYHDRARGRSFSAEEINEIARTVTPEITFQQHGRKTLSPSEVFWLLNRYVIQVPRQPDGFVTLDTSPLGPTERGTSSSEKELTVDWSQFSRTASDVDDFIKRHERLPSTVWLGSQPASPESYLVALAAVVRQLTAANNPPPAVTLRQARLAAGKYVVDDQPGLWGWVIFPPGFHAPAMMELARRQAWTIKPAVLAVRGK